MKYQIIKTKACNSHSSAGKSIYFEYQINNIRTDINAVFRDFNVQKNFYDECMNGKKCGCELDIKEVDDNKEPFPPL